MPEGGVTYDAPETLVQYFRNASITEPTQLACTALADVHLNVMLGGD